MSGRLAARLAWTLFALAVAMLAAALVLSALNGFEEGDNWGSGAVLLFASVPVLAFSLVGALIASRHPRNAVGWVCLASGLALGVPVTAPEYALHATKTDPGALPAGTYAGWLGNWDYLVSIGLLGIYLVLLFPHGRLLSRRWRVVAGLGAVAMLVTAVSFALAPGSLENRPDVRNPLGVESAGDLLYVIGEGGFVLFLLCILASVASMVIRFRRAPGRERQQIKWFAFAAALVAAVFVPVALVDGGGDDDGGGPTLALAQDLATLAFAALPAATGIAILRHRLYDVDVVINRALVYGALTATLAGAYLSSVLLLQLALSPLTEDSGLAVAGSTLAAAALFRPARACIQAAVDRRFYRHRYDAARTLEAFAARLRDEVDLDALNGDLRGVVRETLQPAHASLWLRDPAKLR